MINVDSPTYRIRVDTARRLATLTLLGFWTCEIYDEYTAAVRRLSASGAAAGRPPGQYRVLLDLRRHGVQSKEVAARIEEGLAQGAASGQRHAVLVSQSALHRSQARRIGSHLAPRFFTDEQPALAWLLEEEPST